MGNYIIREGKPEDAKKFINYLKFISSETDYLSSYPDELQLDILEQEKFIKKCSQTENFLFLVVEYKNKIIGNLIFRGEEKRKYKHFGEFGITVSKEYWSKGIAGNLISEMLRWSENTKLIKKIILKVREDNQRAISLYKRFGFKKEGKITKEIFLNNKYYDTIIMGIDIEDKFNYDISFNKNIDPITLRDFYCSFSTWKVPVLINAWEEIIDNSQLIATIWDGDKLIASGRALSDKVRWATIVDVLVDPDYRKKGIGTILVKKMLEQKELDVRSIFLSTDGYQKFYEKLGFTNINNCCSYMAKINMETEDSYILPM